MAGWGYGKADGPSTWGEKFDVAKNGKCQSPINIEPAKAVFDPKLADKPLKINYVPETGMCLKNTGATVQADCKNKNSTLTGGPLGDNVYNLIQFHLHWGSKNDKGAEHTFNGNAHSAELHLVHWNSTVYESFDQAKTKRDGLAVLCIFIKEGSKPHPCFELVSRELPNVKLNKSECKASATFDPSGLIPSNTKRYWTYPGSLTTPPCFESVQFILFEEDVEFSQEQMENLRNMRFGDREDSDKMVDNFRPCCNLNDRKVMKSFRD